MFRKFTLILIVILLYLITIPLALADTKRIAAEILIPSNVDLSGAIVNLFVEVNNGDLGKIICTIKNEIELGESAFSTNLGNLVYKDFLDAPCNDLWSSGDQIWFEVESENGLWVSKKEKINSGTGLQMLGQLKINLAAISKDKGSDMGDSSGGSVDGFEKDLPNKITDPEKKDKMNGVFITLNLELIDGKLKVNNELNFGENNLGDFELKHVVYSYPFEDLVMVFAVKDFSNMEGNSLTNDFSVLDLKPGKYKLRSFIYFSEEVIAVSNSLFFNIDGKKLPVLKKEVEEKSPIPITLEGRALEKIPLWMLISITFDLMALFLFLGKLIKDN